jgi:hypothetical protein
LGDVTIWRWLFVKMGRQNWQRQAAQNQVSQEEILAQPYKNDKKPQRHKEHKVFY